jgi:hypothetical protein
VRVCSAYMYTVLQVVQVSSVTVSLLATSSRANIKVMLSSGIPQNERDKSAVVFFCFALHTLHKIWCPVRACFDLSALKLLSLRKSISILTSECSRFSAAFHYGIRQ